MHECCSRSIAGAEKSESKAQAEARLPLEMAIKGHKELMRVMKAAGYEVVQ
jgi:hypothetical protein